MEQQLIEQEGQLLLTLQRCITLLQARQADAFLRYTRTQLLTAANLLEDLLTTTATGTSTSTMHVQQAPEQHKYSLGIGNRKLPYKGIGDTSVGGGGIRGIGRKIALQSMLVWLYQQTALVQQHLDSLSSVEAAILATTTTAATATTDTIPHTTTSTTTCSTYPSSDVSSSSSSSTGSTSTSSSSSSTTPDRAWVQLGVWVDTASELATYCSSAMAAGIVGVSSGPPHSPTLSHTVSSSSSSSSSSTADSTTDTSTTGSETTSSTTILAMEPLDEFNTTATTPLDATTTVNTTTPINTTANLLPNSLSTLPPLPLVQPPAAATPTIPTAGAATEQHLLHLIDDESIIYFHYSHHNDTYTPKRTLSDANISETTPLTLRHTHIHTNTIHKYTELSYTIQKTLQTQRNQWRSSGVLLQNLPLTTVAFKIQLISKGLMHKSRITILGLMKPILLLRYYTYTY